MAKTCETCQQTYDDGLSHCPHCAQAELAAGEVSEPGQHHKDSGDDVIEIDWGSMEEDTPARPANEEHENVDVIGEHMADPESESGSALFGKEKGTPVPTESYPAIGTTAEPVNVIPESSKSTDDESGVNLGERFDTGSGGLSTLDRMRMAKKLSKEWDKPDQPAREENLEATVLDQSSYQRPRGDGSESEVDLGSTPEVDVSNADSESGDLESLSAFEESAPVAEDDGAHHDAGEPTEEGPALAEFDEIASESEDVGALEGSEVLDEGEGSLESESGFEAALEEQEAPVKPTRRPSTVNPWLGGGVLGAGLASAACVGLWFAGLVPGRESKVSPPASLPVAAVTPPPASPAPAGAPEAAPAPVAESWQAHFDRGDFDKLLQEKPQAKPSPERLEAAGAARWLAYLREQQPKHAPPKADDAAVKQAKADLEASKTPESQLWLGQIQEAIGDVAGARKIYEGALERAKSDPTRERMFQAALDRLDAMSEGADTGEEKTPASTKDSSSRLSDDFLRLDGLRLLVAFVAEPMQTPADAPAQAAPPRAQEAKPDSPAAKPDVPQATQPKPEQQEAGVDFWRAIRLAKESKYAEAIEALRQARTLHDARRFLRLRKSQNPTSDPTEVIFLRSCDELMAAWQARALLHDAGYLKSGSRTAVPQALEKVLSENREFKQGGQAVQTLLSKLQADPDAASAGSKDPAQLLDHVIAGKTKLATEIQAVQQALADAKIADQSETPLVAVQKLIKDAKAQKESVGATVEVLKSENYLSGSDADLNKAVDKLVQDKKGTDEKLKKTISQLQAAESSLAEMEKKLTEVKSATADVHPDQGAKGVELATASNPYLADDHFGAGLGYYWSGRYHEAEREFAQAIRTAGAYDQDARYFYYLALAQFQQGNTQDAADAVRRAALLEQQNKPARAAVNKTLERVQGEQRRFLNSYRP
jgi:tetratricopeptide (TPR) repeat protein